MFFSKVLSFMEFPDVPVHLLSKGVWEDVFWSRGPRAQDPNITQEALGKWDWNCCHMMAPVKHHDKKADGKMKEFRNFTPIIWEYFPPWFEACSSHTYAKMLLRHALPDEVLRWTTALQALPHLQTW